MEKRQRQFASDNYAPICPEAWAALQEANQGHARAYGEDPWTLEAADMVRGLFQTNCDVFFVFNGTSANSLSLASLCQSYHSVLCHETAHIETDECGAPEFFSNGTKLLLLPGELGRIDAAGVIHAATRRQDLHYPKPRALSLTQATELGTVYRPEQIKAICDAAKAHGLRVHMDGARFANAVAFLNADPADITWRAGVDVLSFGATKAGSMVGEAVVFFDRSLAAEFEYRCKQAGQLASKMRFLAAPWVGMLRDGAWLRHARHANSMAELLERLVRQLDVQILCPREANSVFALLPEQAIAAMHAKGWQFYNFIGKGGCRLMCSWDTTEQDVQGFAEDLEQALSS